MTNLFPGVQMGNVPDTSVSNSAAAALAVPSTPQSITTTGLTVLTGSVLPIPNGGLTLGAEFAFDVDVVKTGAGTATATIEVLAGPTGTAADTVVATLVKPAGTANAGEATINVKGRFVGQYATSQVPYLGNVRAVVINSLATQGVISLGSYVTSSVAALTTAQVAALETASFLSLAVALGASDAYTINSVDAELKGLTTGNPA